MIHTEMPATRATAYRTFQKKHTSIITPDKILANEKLLLGVMVSGVALTLLSWAFRKGK